MGVPTMADDRSDHLDDAKDKSVIRVIAMMLAIEMVFLLASLMVLD